MLKYKLCAPDELGGAAGGANAGGAVSADAGAGNAAAPSGDQAATPSIEDTARSAYRELMSGDDNEGADDIPDEPVHKTQPREKGRFAKANGEQAPVDKSGEQQQAQQKTGQQPAQGEQPAAQTKTHDAFPNTWQKDLEAEWAAIPERIRQQIHKREGDFHNGLRQYKDAAGFGTVLAREMLPYQDIMQQMKVTPQAVVRDIMGSLKTLATGSEESKATVFLNLAKQYGINWDTLQTLRQRAPQGADPNLHPVLQRVEQIENRISRADQEREQIERQRDESAVNSFLNDPKNEHAKAVSNEMSALLRSGEASTLDEAYQKAIWLNPTVRASLLEKQEAARREKEAAEVAAAKKAAAVNVTKRPAPPTQTRGTMEDSARSVYRKMMPRG